jgi:hypothetical protein
MCKLIVDSNTLSTGIPRHVRRGSFGRQEPRREQVGIEMREYITKAHYPDAFYPDVSPFGLPLRVDNPNVDPADWEDDDDDD